MLFELKTVKIVVGLYPKETMPITAAATAANKLKIKPIRNVEIILAEIIDDLFNGFVAIIFSVPKFSSFEMDIAATITQ